MSKVIVIDPAAKVAEIDTYENITRMSSLEFSYHLPILESIKSLKEESLEDLKGVIILGGNACFETPSNWQKFLEKWIQVIIDKKIPILGICWGHQWLAYLHGGRVKKVTEKPYKGMRKFRLESNVFGKETGSLVVSHEEAVIEAPKRVRQFLFSSVLENEGFEYLDSPIYTLQCHPEATQTFLRNNEVPLVEQEELLFGHSLVKRFLDSIN